MDFWGYKEREYTFPLAQRVREYSVKVSYS